MEFLTAQDLAKELRVTVDTVWRYTRMGRIPCMRLSDRDYRYRLEDVLASLAAASLESADMANTGPKGRPGLRKTSPDELSAYAGRTGGNGR